MANQATAGNTLNRQAGFSFVSGPFGPTPLLPPFAVAPGTGFLATPLTVGTFAAGTPLPGGYGPPSAPGGVGPAPDNARDNASAVVVHPGNHPLGFNGG